MSAIGEVIAVTGATGQQGGSTARQLLNDGWHVRAVVRDPSTGSARQLAELGAELVVADMDDRDSLIAAFDRAYGVYSVQPALIPPKFDRNELQRGFNVADAAAATHVKHLVYSSVGSADRETGTPHWDIKYRIEQHIASLDLPATIFRPTMFMENHADPTWGILGEQALVRAISSHSKVQMIAVHDIGVFAALAFNNFDQYRGITIELAGDELTLAELVDGISRVTGISPKALAPQLTSTPNANRGDVQMASFSGWSADIKSLRELDPSLMTFHTWLAREGKPKFDKLLKSTRTQ